MSKVLTMIFDSSGNLLEQAYGFGSNNRTEEAKDFDDKMEYISFKEYQKRSTRVRIKSLLTGRTYSMFIDDFNDVILAKRFNNNMFEGTFHFVKRSSGQAAKLLLPKI